MLLQVLFEWHPIKRFLAVTGARRSFEMPLTLDLCEVRSIPHGLIRCPQPKDDNVPWPFVLASNQTQDLEYPAECLEPPSADPGVAASGCTPKELDF